MATWYEIVRYGSFDETYDLANGRAAVLGDASALEEGVLNEAGGEDYEFVGSSLQPILNGSAMVLVLLYVSREQRSD